MSPLNRILVFNAFLIGLVILSIASIDRPLSGFIENNLTGLKPLFHYFTVNADHILNFILNELFGSFLYFLLFCIVAGLACLLAKRAKVVGFFLLTMAFAYPATSLLANVLKMEVKRARPEVYLRGDERTKDFYSEQMPNDSFPSGHAVGYLSMFLPAALAYRKYSAGILLIPGIIIMGRVVQNYHYLSDVLFSVFIGFNLCLLVYFPLYYLDRALAKLLKNGNSKGKAADTNAF